MFSNQMIKLYGNSFSERLSIIFNDYLDEGKFTYEWKKSNVVPVHRIGNKQSP